MGKSKDAYRTISEVADWLDTQAHVLRFWESKFSQVKPVKRAGGRRYYRPADMLLLGGIKRLLHDDGMTIKGVQKLLRENGVKHVSALSQPLDDGAEDIVDSPIVEAEKPNAGKALPEAKPELASVIEFAKPSGAPSAQASAPAPAAEEEGRETAGDETAGDLPGADELPAFLQRISTSEDGSPQQASPEADPAAAEQQPPQPAPSQEATSPQATSQDADSPPTAAAAAPADTTPQDDTAAHASPPRDTSQDTSQDMVTDPADSLLSALGQPISIAPENRAEARALLARLEALRLRMAESENA
ncbi:MerR family transcriptional regulator [Shimia sp.]|uniref:MerR family transcriptional regulator n=1 Tax=Shimia sp. TaxID=1954381 RepID=UPI00356A62F0